MIKISSNVVSINGELTTILTECTTILRNVYSLMVDAIGEENANSHLALMGRLAVMSEEDLENEEFQGKI